MGYTDTSPFKRTSKMANTMRQLRRFPANFVAALIVSMAATAAMPTLDRCCHDRTTGLGDIDPNGATSDNELPVGARRLLPGLPDEAARIHPASGIRAAATGDHSRAAQVQSPRRVSTRVNHRSWIDDAKVSNHQSPRGPPSV
jgi:hypothetical protein